MEGKQCKQMPWAGKAFCIRNWLKAEVESPDNAELCRSGDCRRVSHCTNWGWGGKRMWVQMQVLLRGETD